MMVAHPHQIYSFGYPKQPTDKFPDAITEAMARDFYAFLVTICSQHFLSALPMIPVLIYGWDDSSDMLKSLFLLGTLSDVGFDVYDFISSTLRAFQKNHPNPIPTETWFLTCLLHHTTVSSCLISRSSNHFTCSNYNNHKICTYLGTGIGNSDEHQISTQI